MLTLKYCTVNHESGREAVRMYKNEANVDGFEYLAPQVFARFSMDTICINDDYALHYILYHGPQVLKDTRLLAIS